MFCFILFVSVTLLASISHASHNSPRGSIPDTPAVTAPVPDLFYLRTKVYRPDVNPKWNNLYLISDSGTLKLGPRESKNLMTATLDGTTLAVFNNTGNSFTLVLERHWSPFAMSPASLSLGPRNDNVKFSTMMVPNSALKTLIPGEKDWSTFVVCNRNPDNGPELFWIAGNTRSRAFIPPGCEGTYLIIEDTRFNVTQGNP
ncbi:MAG: hypothetical protein M1825_001435 [Sarcosagium campestre]|nr:MAG: hypothetical protein M1825_001435 [Sarcosagium campestre]